MTISDRLSFADGSHQLFYNWGNCLFRRALQLMDLKPNDDAQAVISRASNLLLAAIGKYSQVLQHKPNFDRARMNWAKSIKALVEAQVMLNAANAVDDMALDETDDQWAPPADSLALLELRRFLDEYESAFRKGTSRSENSCEHE
jgi:hypothetical protein